MVYITVQMEQQISQGNEEIDDWEIAWVSDGTKWSTKQYSNGEEIPEE